MKHLWEEIEPLLIVIYQKKKQTGSSLPVFYIYFSSKIENKYLNSF